MAPLHQYKHGSSKDAACTAIVPCTGVGVPFIIPHAHRVDAQGSNDVCQSSIGEAYHISTGGSIDAANIREVQSEKLHFPYTSLTGF
jgi:hypothetical protein